ncbi:ankyrin repeat domain-containing protein [Sphingomonas sp. GCM10030256]|uniref:ankyrin repeat domain-containing protein n=1 Tax=Sphingomonas sp. GCM10030256 TaxID=3273427 RepID=UPI003607295F
MRALGVAVLLGLSAAGAGAQMSAGFTFLKAVEERDGGKATELLQTQGSTVVNFRDDKGNGALHILAGGRDRQWMGFMLGKQADPNLQNRAGDTPLLVASRIGYLEGVDLLLRSGGKVDLANRLGETPLIVAVQQRQLPVVKRLLEAGANPDRPDNASGRTARDYAKLDRRSTELVRLIETASAKAKPQVAGPKL